jgi:hypothetical protein
MLSEFSEYLTTGFGYRMWKEYEIMHMWEHEMPEDEEDC